MELEADTRVVSDLIKVSKNNQHRIRVDPFEVMLMRMGFRLAMAEGAGAGPQNNDDAEGEGQEARPPRRARGDGGGGGEEGRQAGGEGREDWNDLGWIENPANCRPS